MLTFAIVGFILVALMVVPLFGNDRPVARY